MCGGNRHSIAAHGFGAVLTDYRYAMSLPTPQLSLGRGLTVRSDPSAFVVSRLRSGQSAIGQFPTSV